MKFIKKVGRKAIKVLVYSFLVRLAIKILVSKFDIKKVRDGMLGVGKFGISCALFTLIFHIARRVLAATKIFIKKSKIETHKQNQETT